MKNTLVNLNSNKPGCVGFDHECLYISSQFNHETFEELKEFAMGNQKPGRKGYSVIGIQNIEEIHFHQKGQDFFFRYKQGEKQKKCCLHIKNNEMRIAFCESLAETVPLRTRIETNNPYSRVAVNLPPLMIGVFLTWGSYYLAQNGIVDNRGAIPRLVTGLLQDAGAINVLIIGSVLITFFLFRLIRNIITSDTSIEYIF